MSLTDDQIVAKNFKKYHEAILPYLNGSAHSGFTPIGTVISVMGTTAPLNYLACDGTVYNISDYPELAAYFNAQFGASNHFGGNGTTTFAVPDLRGEFLRGTGTNSHANQGSGAAVGEHQDGTEHIDFSVYPDSKQLSVDVNNAQYMISGNVDKRITTGKIGGSKSTLTYTAGGDDRMLFTSRPTNTSVLYCIASKNIFMDAGSNYSTEEQVVGTWIDGSYIYQKTVEFGALSNAGEKGVNHNISNLKLVTNVMFIKYKTDNPSSEMSVVPFVHDTSINYQCVLTIDASKIYVANRGVNYSTFSGICTLQYTKTTDA